ncbi:hypothetical protein [Sphingobium boeckii]|uniref:Uncharacterized protein n=1 Tax=Sphingobium boeckii TaxID=1082345 RepID=A0A7W9EE83_9SPHN|nr:hypothetical protein [Sphingobium boeckii]MBB5685744.1 hypothetical protein [Sphingobium boeckii]
MIETALELTRVPLPTSLSAMLVCPPRHEKKLPPSGLKPSIGSPIDAAACEKASTARKSPATSPANNDGVNLP